MNTSYTIYIKFTIATLFLILSMRCSDKIVHYDDSAISIEDFKLSTNLTILSSKRNNIGDLLIVTCKNLKPNTIIMIGDHPLITTYSDSTIKCVIPPEYIDKPFDFMLVNIALKEKTDVINQIFDSKSDTIPFSIGACGFGGNAVWLICKNHRYSTQLYFEGKILETVVYADHLVGILPENCKNMNNVQITIDDKTKNQKMELNIQR